jgi:hypothetical protein
MHPRPQPRPSRQEMEKVQRMGTKMVDNAADLVTKFREACTKAGLDPQDVAKQADVDLNNLTDSVMPKLRDAFKNMQNKPLFASKEKEEAFLEQVREVIPTATEQEPQIKDPNAPASSAQIGKLRAMLMANASGNDQWQHDAVSDIVNRSISKLDMLTKGEANKAIKAPRSTLQPCLLNVNAKATVKATLTNVPMNRAYVWYFGKTRQTRSAPC